MNTESCHIYLITNSVNGKRYVGITTRTPERRWLEHLDAAQRGRRYAMPSAIRKYGATAFQIETLEVCPDVATGLIREQFWIEALGTMVPLGYNTTAGGRGVLRMAVSEETRAKQAAAIRGRKHSEASRARMRQIARQRPAEHLQKIAAAMRGRSHTDEARAKIRKARAQQVFSPEAIERRTQKLRGRTHTDQAKANMSAAQQGREVTATHRAKIRDTLRALTPAQAAIIKFNALGVRQKDYAHLFGVSVQTVCCIVNGRQYADVTCDQLPVNPRCHLSPKN